MGYSRGRHMEWRSVRPFLSRLAIGAALLLLSPLSAHVEIARADDGPTEFQQMEANSEAERHNAKMERLVHEQNELLRQQVAASLNAERAQPETVVVRVPVERIVTKEVPAPTAEDKILGKGDWYILWFATGADLKRTMIYVDRRSLHLLGRFRAGWLAFGDLDQPRWAFYAIADCKTMTLDFPIDVDGVFRSLTQPTPGTLLSIGVQRLCTDKALRSPARR
jgi:hypothetical protein